MAITTLTRSLRDGQLAIEDGHTPARSLVLDADAGDLRWTVPGPYRAVLDRGRLDHVRAGSEQPCAFAFTVRFDNLYGAGTTPEAVYEMLTLRSDLSLVSTAPSGWSTALRLVFTVTDPADSHSERITFNYCYFQSVTPAERAPHNVIAVAGFDFETAPVVEAI